MFLVVEVVLMLGAKLLDRVGVQVVQRAPKAQVVVVDLLLLDSRGLVQKVGNGGGAAGGNAGGCKGGGGKIGPWASGGCDGAVFAMDEGISNRVVISTPSGDKSDLAENDA